MPTTLPQSNLPGLELIHRGKVRDVYALDEHRLLMVATDRLSAFDVVLPNPIPGKGEMLTQISNFWFGKTAHLVPNHLLDVPLADVLPPGTDLALYAKRAVVTRRLKPVPVECIARGYLIGSGWKDYQKTGAVCGIALPAGIKQAQQLPEPIFTPSTKAAVGDHDENVSFDAVVSAVGAELAGQVRDFLNEVRQHSADSFPAFLHRHEEHEQPSPKQQQINRAVGFVRSGYIGRGAKALVSAPAIDQATILDKLRAQHPAGPAPNQIPAVPLDLGHPHV